MRYDISAFVTVPCAMFVYRAEAILSHVALTIMHSLPASHIPWISEKITYSQNIWKRENSKLIFPEYVKNNIFPEYLKKIQYSQNIWKRENSHIHWTSEKSHIPRISEKIRYSQNIWMKYHIIPEYLNKSASF